MYLDLYDNLTINRKLLKIAGPEVAVYWAEVSYIMLRVVRKGTHDEGGFFCLDREYMERATTLTITKQLKCEDRLIELGALIRDPEKPNRIAIGVNNMIEIISGEDTKKLKKSTKAAKDEAKAAKVEGIKASMKRALTEQDPEVRKALELWVEGMIDAANCRFTKAVVQLFEKTVNDYTKDKATRLKIIEIATTNSYRDATWAINKLGGSNFRQSTATKLPQQKICVGVSDDVSF
jgi:adenine-specific DNA glycosylase